MLLLLFFSRGVFCVIISIFLLSSRDVFSFFRLKMTHTRNDNEKPFAKLFPVIIGMLM